MVGVGNSLKIAHRLEYCSIMVQWPMILKAIWVLNIIQSYLLPAVRRQFLMIQLKDRAKQKNKILILPLFADGTPKPVVDLTADDDFQKAIAASLEATPGVQPAMLGGQITREDQDISR